MINLSLRDFQQKGKLAVGKNPSEPVLLTGRSGPLFFLIPVEEGNIDNQYRELLKAMGQSSLREWQQRALELGVNEMSPDKINQEIVQARKIKRTKSK